MIAVTSIYRANSQEVMSVTETAQLDDLRAELAEVVPEHAALSATIHLQPSRDRQALEEHRSELAQRRDALEATIRRLERAQHKAPVTEVMTPAPDPLEEDYARAVLDAHLGVEGAQERLTDAETAIDRRQQQVRREAALQSALTRRASEEAEAARRAEAEAEAERRGLAREQLEAARAAARRAGKAWARAAGEACRFGVEADNLALHSEIAEELRGLVARTVPLPWSRRVLDHLGGWPSARHRGPENGSAA